MNRLTTGKEHSEPAIVLDQAVQILLKQVRKISEKENIPLWDSVGRILAEDQIAERNQPPFDRSPLDGYAVKSDDTKGAVREKPRVLRVIAEVDAGHVTEKTVERGTAVRIMTGAPIPVGADCVIRQEDTDYGEEKVEIYKEIKRYQNYCFAGEDYKAGALLLKKGMKIDAVSAGVLASLGLERVSVYRKARVAVLTTGDEIVLPGEQLPAGKIYDSNLYTLVTRLCSLGAEITYGGRVEDHAGKAAEILKREAKNADFLITTGGVSVGRKDIMHEVLEILCADRLFWKIAIKPGMPTLCADYQGKLLICLSGNPYGATVNLELLVRPLLAKLMGREDLNIKRVTAVCQNSFPKRSPVTRYVRANYEDGKVSLTDGSNESGILSSMCGCNCLMEIPGGTECVQVGDETEVLLL